MMSTEVEPQDWQLHKSLEECNRRMFDSQVSCDIQFVVGTDPSSREKIGAHKYILISRSPVFFAMLCGELHDPNVPIEVTDIDSDAFRQMLRFLYTDKPQLTPDLVLPVLYASKKYMVPALAEACVTFLEDHLSPDNVGLIYEQSLFYDEAVLVSKCVVFIETHTEEIFRSPGITEISLNTLCRILEFDKLFIGELELFRGCMRWAEQECVRRNLIPDPDNIRASLDKALFLIRFPTMELSDFANVVGRTRILTAEEKCCIFEYMTVEECDHLCEIMKRLEFPTTFRQRPMPSVVTRFTAFGKSNVYSGDCSIMKVQANKPVLLKGLGISGSTAYDPLSDVSVSIKQEKRLVLTSTIAVNDDRSGDVIHVMFPENVFVRSGLWYTVVIGFNFLGDHDQGSCQRGRGGSRCITTDGVTFDFDRGDSAGFIAEVLFCRV